jgi:hypothetical protein
VLRFWTGLVLAEQGRPALAAAEMAAAVGLGFPHWRASWYLAEAAAAAGSDPQAQDALSRVRQLAPDFEPARRLNPFS